MFLLLPPHIPASQPSRRLRPATALGPTACTHAWLAAATSANKNHCGYRTDLPPCARCSASLLHACLTALLPADQARDFIKQALRKDPSQRPTVHMLLRHPWLRAYQVGPGGVSIDCTCMFCS